MIDIAPDAWSVFPWSEGIRRGDDLSANKPFVVFVGNFVSMLDMAIDMLGPDLEMVEEQLQKLGIRHIRYGVMPKHYPLMGKALLNTLEHLLGDSFDEKHHCSWNAIYTFMSVTMMQGAFQELVRVYEERNKSDLHDGVSATKPLPESSRRKPQNASVGTIATIGMCSHDGDTSILSSSVDDDVATSSSSSRSRRKSDQWNDVPGSKPNRKSLFSSSEFVKRFTRGTKL